MGLVNVLRELGLEDLQLAGEVEEVLAEVSGVDQLVKIVVARIKDHLLPCQHERKLLFQGTNQKKFKGKK